MWRTVHKGLEERVQFRLCGSLKERGRKINDVSSEEDREETEKEREKS